MGFYQKYRPQAIEDVIGNDSIKNSLLALLDKPGHPRAFLFTGPSGCGKTTFARIIKNHLKCSDRDYFELNTASVRGIDTIREISSSAQLTPMMGKVKIYLLDETHQVTGAAAEALLKTLEDPPKHAYFILCTTNPEKLLPTIKTRCTQYQVSPLVKRDIIALCKRVLAAEGLDTTIGVLTEIAKSCDGSPRKALVLLESVVGVASEEEQLKILQAARADEATTKDLIDALLNKAKWTDVAKILKALEGDPEAIRRQILGYANAMVLGSTDPVAGTLLMTAFEKNYYDTGKSGLTMSCVNVLYS